MALSTARNVFGIHSISPYNKTTGVFYGTAKCVGGSTFSLSGETVELTGGASRYPWAVEDGGISAELSMTLKEYPDWAFEVFLGKAPTASGAAATGTISALTNKSGTSLVDASTGIASVGLKSASSAELKAGKYVVKVTGAATVMVYCSSDVDFARGTDEAYDTDLLAISSANLTISTGAGTDLDNFGLTFTGGSGTIGMTTGDTATFEVLPICSSSMAVTIGGLTDVYPTFGCILVAQQQGTGRMFEIDVFSVKAIGMPFNLTAKEFSEAEITGKAFYDSARSGVFSVRDIVI